MGFPRQKTDGTTSLAILVPGDGVDPKRPKERPVSLGQIIGKLQRGVAHLDQFNEDMRNIAKPVRSLNYGAFGSYAPSYDSTFSTISREESNLIYGSFGVGDTALTESITNCSKDFDYTLTMVDNLLDVLSGGEHKKNAGKQAEDDISREMAQAASSKIKTEFDQLKTLTELGIDISFLNEYEKMEVDEPNVIQTKLDESSELLKKLHQVQTKRLSAPHPPHLSRVLQPSDTELILVDKVTGSLTELAKQLPPEALVSVRSVRKAMGVELPQSSKP